MQKKSKTSAEGEHLELSSVPVGESKQEGNYIRKWKKETRKGRQERKKKEEEEQKDCEVLLTLT